ncbi:hypothetical protein LYZ37_22560 [Vibrio tubiashii]|uniref:hypothetical protein n=1 Tax=Vibrio tubiashii TaxID=29498 RepID=UPI00234ED125|nr:hypothetical protein [Vibrio tubiashii]WCP69306.1 hypothetical protein LYZ37_22560 [Vibrio tubiashii]
MTFELKVTLKDIIVTVICIVWSTLWISSEIDNHQEMQQKQFNELKDELQSIIQLEAKKISAYQ